MIGYPLLLEPRYDVKIWGGRRLETVLGKPLPIHVPVGESLESGDEARITNGPLAGMTLHEVTQRDGNSLLGTRGLQASQPFGDFPLLVKFIDASDVLSLQVHPDDDGARPHDRRGKTEAWYIVAAEPGASLITGMSRPATAGEMRSSIQDGCFEELLERCVVTGGETLMVPAGTMHAIGRGVLLYEIQEASDVTFRLYDWGRVDDQGRPRELHLDQALDALRHDLHATATQPLALDDWRDVLVACHYFALERWQLSGTRALRPTRDTTFRLLTCIQGQTRLESPAWPVDLPAGWTVLLPADMRDVAISGEATLICAFIPDLNADIAGPLLARGHAPKSIELLAGETRDLSFVAGA